MPLKGRRSGGSRLSDARSWDCSSQGRTLSRSSEATQVVSNLTVEPTQTSMLQWILPAFAVALLLGAVALAVDGRFGVALAISVVAGCCLQLDRLRSRLR